MRGAAASVFSQVRVGSQVSLSALRAGASLGSACCCESRVSCDLRACVWRLGEESLFSLYLYSYREYTLIGPTRPGGRAGTRAGGEAVHGTRKPASGGRAVVGRQPSIASPG